MAVETLRLINKTIFMVEFTLNMYKCVIEKMESYWLLAAVLNTHALRCIFLCCIHRGLGFCFKVIIKIELLLFGGEQRRKKMADCVRYAWHMQLSVRMQYAQRQCECDRRSIINSKCNYLALVSVAD